MIEQHIGLIEMGLVFGFALALGFWELASVRRALRESTPPDGETEVPPRSEP